LLPLALSQSFAFTFSLPIFPMFHIRTLQTSDSLLELTDLLHAAYARLGAMGLNYTSVDQSPEVTAERIAGGQCYVAELAGQLVGTIVVKPTYAQNECDYFTQPGVAAVHQFAVTPALQGQGLGRALLQVCEQWAAEHGFRELAMDTAEQATHLIKLYSSLGYQLVGGVQWTGKVYRSVMLSKVLSEASASV
jgi:GNAT superfamily N-acetyltransferase